MATAMVAQAKSVYSEDAMVKKLLCSFDNDTLILPNKAIMNNALSIQNNTSKSITFKLRIDLPQKWTLIYKPQPSITLAAGASTYIPFRMSMNDELEFNNPYHVKASLIGKTDSSVLQKSRAVVLFIKNYKRRWRGMNPQTKRPYFVDLSEGRRIKTYFDVERDVYKANMILKNKLWVENLSDRPIAIDINLSIPERWTLIVGHTKRKVLRAGEKLAIPFRIFISPRAIRGMEYALIGKIISDKGFLLKNTYGYVTITKKEDPQIFFVFKDY